MIRVDRNAVAVPKALVGAKSAGVTERARAVDYYGAKDKTGMKEPTFAAYKNPSVIAAIEALFGGKCAYCEARYNSTAPVDVEHFRPKGGYNVGSKLRQPGYYWLAAEWTNLLPSCIDCNRERGHLTDTDAVVKSGKANHFPLADERKRASRPGDEPRESPLLLNPCEDDPEQHLEFLDEGVVRPRVGSTKAGPSIEVYGLQRMSLVQHRLEVALRVLATVQNLKDIDALVTADNKNALLKQVRARLRSELEQSCAPKSQFSALAKSLITRHYGRL